MKKFKRSILVLALAVILAFGATACQPAGGNGGIETLKGVTSEKIVVGNTAGTTGALAFIGTPFNLGIEAAFAAYNAKGGYTGKVADGTTANGLKVELKHYDDGGDETKALSMTEQLIVDDEVFAIVGNFGSYAVNVNLDIIKEEKVPMVYAAAGNDSLHNENAKGDDAYVFPVQPLNVTEGRMLLARAFAPVTNSEGAKIGGLGAKKVGVIVDTSDASQAIYKGIVAEANNLGVAKEINVQTVTTTDYSAAVNALKADNCDVVIVTVIGTAFTAACTAFINASYKCKVLTSYNNANAAVFNDPANNNLLAAAYANLFNTIELYAQAWLDIYDTSYAYVDDTPLNVVYKALSEATWNTSYPEGKYVDYSALGVMISEEKWNTMYPEGKFVYYGTTGFSREYWTVAVTVDPTTAFAMSYDSYALAGYIAGDLFCQGLEALQAAGKELTRANYVEIMETKEYQIAMADTISFANGMRAGVESFALTQMSVSNYAATSATIHTLTSLKDYRAIIKG